MYQLKNIFYSLLVIAAFVAMGYLVVHIGDMIFFEKNKKYIENGVGAFAGAFFAFIFLWFSEQLKLMRERRQKHIRALVKLEHVINENLVINHDNLIAMRSLIDCLNRGVCYRTKFIPLNIDKDSLLDLMNIDFINDMFNINIDAYKINESLKTISLYYNDANELLSEKKINESNYTFVLKNKFMDDLKYTLVFMEKFDEKLETMMVKSQILLKKNQTTLNKFYQKIFGIKYPRNFSELIDARLANFRIERKNLWSASVKEIASIAEKSKK